MATEKHVSILLIGNKGQRSLRSGQFLTPPIGLYRIASYIQQESGFSVEVIDPNLVDKTKLVERVRNGKFSIIGMSILQPCIIEDLRIISAASKASPESILIAGGQGASNNYSELLSSTPLDIVVRGFGEKPLLEIAEKFNPKKTLVEQYSSVLGLYIKDGNRILKTKDEDVYSCEYFRQISRAFNFNLVDYEKYWNHMGKIYSDDDLEARQIDKIGFRVIRIITATHCPMGCDFCSSSKFLDISIGQKQRVLQLSPTDIIYLIKKAVAAHPKAEAIYFNDDNFLFSKERAGKLCDAIIGAKLANLSYFCAARVDSADPTLLSKLASANFKLIIYGVESFSNRMLQDMEKKIDSADPCNITRQAIIETIKAGITPLMNLILFYPTSSIEDLCTTIDSSVDLVQKGARIAVYPYLEAYRGANILSKGYPISDSNFKLGNTEFSVPSVIPPINKQVSMIATAALRLKHRYSEYIRKKYQWTDNLPQTIDGLILFLTIYKLLKLPTESIEQAISSVFSQSNNHQKKSCDNTSPDCQ